MLFFKVFKELFCKQCNWRWGSLFNILKGSSEMSYYLTNYKIQLV